MIKIKALASGSRGNCYWVSDGTHTLLLECGIRFKEIQEGIDFRISELAGVLCSHEHQDHCKAVNNLMKAGVNVYASPGTIQALGITGHRIIPVKKKKTIKVGEWSVLPFKTEHDCEDPLGFVLQNKEKERLLYATDTYYLRYKFPSLTHIIIECNYSLDILNRNVEAGIVPAVHKNRVIQSHMSLETAKKFLKVNDLSKVQEIWLLHLSDQNSNAKLFKEEIMAVSGKPVYIAGGD